MGAGADGWAGQGGWVVAAGGRAAGQGRDGVRCQGTVAVKTGRRQTRFRRSNLRAGRGFGIGFLTKMCLVVYTQSVVKNWVF